MGPVGRSVCNYGVSRDQREVEEVEIKCVNGIIGERGGGEMEP